MTDARATLPLPVIMLVTDRKICGERSLDDVVAAAVDGGVNVVQVREKDLSGGQLFALVTRLAGIVRRRALLLVNERVDVAIAAGADGVQLGEDALPPQVVRAMAPGLLISRSVHDTTGAAEAAARGADMLVVGSMFATGSHPGALPGGPTLLRKIAASVSVPLVGIGGIRAANASQVIGAGAAGVAVLSKIQADPDPRASANRLASAVREAWPTAPLHRRRS
ncbi:MAG: thiamine phosphate synthase [Chloroflexota bacterium]